MVTNNLYKLERTALPGDTKKAIGNDKPENFALLFNRMGHFAKKEELSQELEVDSLLSQEIKFHFFHKSRVSKQDYHLDLTKKWHVSKRFKKDYETFLINYGEAAKALSPNSLEFDLETDWRIALGMGNASVYENGFTFHSTYGIPYLPGSSLKGMARHWAKTEGKDNEGTDYLKIFGNEQYESKNFHQGQILFFDALPTQLSQDMVQPDIMNNHYPDYYEGNKPPADWLSPRPIFFLTMKGVSFQFHLGYISRDGEATGVGLLETAKQWLKCALGEAGIGAKTAVGYGRMRDKEDAYVSPKEPEMKREPQFKEGRTKKFKNGDKFEAVVTKPGRPATATVYGYEDKKHPNIQIAGRTDTLKAEDIIRVTIQAGKQGKTISSASLDGIIS
jgi:CRISPR-associated protein Cmr6